MKRNLYRTGSPEEKLARTATVKQRTQGWVIMDQAGEFFLRLDNTVSQQPQHWQSRDDARQHLWNWLGVPAENRRPGPKPPSKPGISDRASVFERQIACLMMLWQVSPNGLTITEAKEAIEKQMGKNWGTHCFRRDLNFFCRMGFCVRHGANFVATDKGRYWYDQTEAPK